MTASQFLHSGAYDTAVVVGADALSRWVDWSDRNTCILFGDGAGAVVLRASAGGGSAGVGPGLLGFAMHSNGADQPQLCLPYQGSKRAIGRGSLEGAPDAQEASAGSYGAITMNGKAVYSFATREVSSSLGRAAATRRVAVTLLPATTL